MRNKHIAFILVVILFTSCMNKSSEDETSASLLPGKDWPRYGGNKASNRYSPLDQINIDNIQNLKVAWMYNAGEITEGDDNQRAKPIQCQPIVIDGIMYGTSAALEVFAVDAGTGKELWKFSPGRQERQRFNTSRGVVYWQKDNDKRILFTVGAYLYALNAQNGELIKDFGEDGKTDLHQGLSDNLTRDIQNLSVTASTPGVIYKDNIIMGSSVSESGDAAPGHIRAFDVVTGKLKWVFHTIPQPGEFGYDTWPKDAYKEIGGVNNWSGLSLDEDRGVVYLGTGSPGSDFYGGNREGKNLFATCILALDAATGKLKWYYQTIHHDRWDRDHPVPPNLTTIKHNGKKVDVVVQATKDGLVYVLDRDTGESIFPVEERAVPTNGLPGEKPWPTQKYPVKPLPLSHQVMTEEDITDLSPESHAYVKDIYLKYRSDNKFTPPSVEGTLLFGYSGGAEWGGNAIDSDGILYQNTNDDPWILQMTDTVSRNKELASLSHGNAMYEINCAACHGADRKGSGTQFPDLTRIQANFNKAQVAQIIKTGSGRMPSFQHLPQDDREAIVDYLFNPWAVRPKVVTEHTEVGTSTPKEVNNDFGFKPLYVNKVWRKLSDQDGYPGIKPPWGTLNAIDLNTGDYLWRVPLGEYPELTKRGIPITGTESYGGPIVTAGGLVFIAGTKDERIRAFDKKTGKVVWEYQLPAGGFATPITYEINSKQYVVIAAGGGRGQKPGGNYVAFALKDQETNKN